MILSFNSVFDFCAIQKNDLTSNKKKKEDEQSHVKQFEAAEAAQAKQEKATTNGTGEDALADELAAFADDMDAFDGLEDAPAPTKPKEEEKAADT